MKKQRWIIVLGIMVLVLAAIGPMASAAPKKQAPAGDVDVSGSPGWFCLDALICPDGIGGSCSCGDPPVEPILVDPYIPSFIPSW